MAGRNYGRNRFRAGRTAAEGHGRNNFEHTTDELSFHFTRDIREGTARPYPADSYYVQALEKVNKYLTIEDFSSAACELER